jgi:3-hydroxyacyl-CoA dehydrogenase
VLIICEGRTFFAGADISEFGKPIQDPWLPELLNTIESTDRCAVPSAKIGLPEVKLGLLPGAGGTQRTPRLAGIEAALELMTSGVPVAASRAKELGLVDEIVAGDLREGALTYVRKLLDSDAPVRRTSEIDPPKFGDFDALRAAVTRRARGQVGPSPRV